MQSVHALLDGYEAKAPGVYPEELKAQVAQEIEKLKVYQTTIHEIPSDVRTLINTVFSRMIMPFFSKQ